MQESSDVRLEILDLTQSSSDVASQEFSAWELL